MLKEKHNHVFAIEIAKKLIKNDFSWDNGMEIKDETALKIERNEDTKTKGNLRSKKGSIEIKECKESSKQDDAENNTPLFIATSRGITEIVEEILVEHPRAIEHLNNIGQNILHVAVLHRRKNIFNLLHEKNILWKRMSRRIDNNGRTLLHQVAETKHYTGGTRHGPALQLQEEISWFQRVRELCPDFYHTHKDGVSKMTAKELFRKNHQETLKEAKKWIKETAQSCSAVAVLVATVVYAAAYTVPGGNNDKGIPIFIDSPYFLFFTITDVVSLASSLTSVVMFLSILTASFDLEDFHHSLPRKLKMGFTFLFFSIITTMLSFGATILLIVRQEKEWTASLISIAAFLPTSVFVLMQYRLYSALWDSLKEFFKSITMKTIKCIRSLRDKRKQDPVSSFDALMREGLLDNNRPPSRSQARLRGGNTGEGSSSTSAV